MIIGLLYLILFTTILVLAFKIATAENMLLGSVGNYSEYQVEQGHKVFELIRCPFCMPNLFVFGAWIFAFALGLIPFEINFKYIALHVLAVCGSSITSGFIWEAYTAMNARKERDEAEKEHYEKRDKYYEHIEQLAFFDLKDRKDAYNQTKRHNGVNKQY